MSTSTAESKLGCVIAADARLRSHERGPRQNSDHVGSVCCAPSLPANTDVPSSRRAGDELDMVVRPLVKTPGDGRSNFHQSSLLTEEFQPRASRFQS